MNAPGHEPQAGDRLLLATAASLYVAGLLLVCVVLPAEFGRDPLGTGRLMGLAGLRPIDSGQTGSEAVRSELTSFEQQPYREDTRTFVLRPSAEMEFKYRFARAGGGMVYSWRATGPVHFDFHGEPENARAQNYLLGDGDSGHGTFIAPAPGIHGWYWKNGSEREVTVTLKAAGYFAGGVEFLPSGPIERQIPAP